MEGDSSESTEKMSLRKISNFRKGPCRGGQPISEI